MLGLVVVVVVVRGFKFGGGGGVMPRRGGIARMAIEERLLDDDECPVGELNVALAERDALRMSLAEARQALDRSVAERQLLAASLQVTEATLAEYRALIDDLNLRVSKGIGGPRKRTKKMMRDEILAELLKPMMPLDEYEAKLKDIPTMDTMDDQLDARIADLLAFAAEWHDDARSVILAALQDNK